MDMLGTHRNLELLSRIQPSIPVTAEDPQMRSTARMPTVACCCALHQRDPAIFIGTGHHDVERWLASTERVNNHIEWDDAPKLNNAILLCNRFW